MSGGYVELHVKSFYSFGLGASHVHELLARAREYGYDALALTDTNLCGALEFARLAGSLGIRPVTGGELTLTDDSRLVLLARTREGYANISRLFTLANAADRREPRLDPRHLPEHAGGVTLLTGGRGGPLDRLLLEKTAAPMPCGCCATTWTGSARTRCSWNCSRTSSRATRGATGNWSAWPPRPASLWSPPTTCITTPPTATACSTPWWPPNTTPLWTRLCPSSIPTGTCASSRPRGWRSFSRNTRRR